MYTVNSHHDILQSQAKHHIPFTSNLSLLHSLSGSYAGAVALCRRLAISAQPLYQEIKRQRPTCQFNMYPSSGVRGPNPSTSILMSSHARAWS